MQVPFDPNPVTNAPDTTLNYQQAPNIDVTGGLGQDVQRLGGLVKEDQTKRQQLDVTNLVLQEVNQREGYLQDAMIKAPPGAHNFTQDTMANFQARDAAVRQQLMDSGYSHEVIGQGMDRLDKYNNVARNKAFVFQQDAVYRNAQLTSQDTLQQLGTYVGSHPGDVIGAKDQFKTSLDLNPDLDETRKAEMLKTGYAMLETQGRTSYAMQHPDEVLNHFDPYHSLDGGVGPGVPTTIDTVYGNGKYATPAAPLSSMPISSVQDFQANQLIPATRGKVGAGPDKGTGAVGAYQITHDTLAQYAPQVLGPDWASQPFSAENQDKIAAARYADAKDGDLHAVWAGMPHNVPGQYSNVPWEQVRATIVAKETGGKIVSNPTEPGTPNIQFGAASDNPNLNNVDPTEAMRMISIAKSLIGQRSAQQKGALENTFNNATQAMVNNGGEYGGQLPTYEELAPHFGATAATNMVQELSNSHKVGIFLKGVGQMNNDQLMAAAQLFKPTDTASPTYSTDMASYDKVMNAAYSTIQARQKDPAGYVWDNNPGLAKQLQTAKTIPDQKAAFAGLAASYQQLGVPQDKQLPFSPQQLTATLQKYGEAPANQRVAMWQTWQQTMPPTMFHNMQIEMVRHDPKMASDVLMSQLVYANPNFAPVAGKVALGLDIARNDPARNVPQSFTLPAFRANAGDATSVLNPAAAGAFEQAARAIYIADGGKVPSKALEISDPHYQAALRQAFGGSATNPDTGIYQKPLGWHFMPNATPNTATILPPGITGTQFQNWIDKAPVGTFAQAAVSKAMAVDSIGHPVPENVIKDHGVFVMAAPGQYYVKSDRDGKFFGDGRGGKYVVQITPQMVGGR